MRATRRSTRLAEKNDLSVKPPGASEAHETQMRTRKRKLSTKQTQDAQSMKKKFNTVNKLICMFEELPYKLLHEIFKCLNPTALLHLSRTSKSLRALLMSRKVSNSLWISARSNMIIPPLPDCPDDLSEPTYAELVFGEGCHYCEHLVDTYHAWRVRKRICTECIGERCKDYRTFKQPKCAFPARHMRGLLPRIQVTREDEHGQIRRTTYLFVEYLKIWEQGYQEAKGSSTRDGSIWLKSQYNLQAIYNQHSELCQTWLNEYVSIHRLERRIAIRKRVEELARWEQDLTTLSDLQLEFPNVGSVIEVLNHNWSSLDPKIILYMDEIKERRIREEQELLIEARLPIFQEAFLEHLSTIPVVAQTSSASAAEIFVEPTIQAILILNTPLDVPFTKEHLIPAIAAIYPDATRHLRLRVQDQLYEHIRNANFPGDVSDRDMIFDLATTVFLCNHGTCRLSRSNWNQGCFWFEHILHHKCNRTHEFSEGFKLRESAGRIFGRSFHSHTIENIRLNAKLVKFVTILVDLCGLDYRVTTKAKMDTIDPIFECIDCHDNWTGRATMTWTAMVRHYWYKHRDTMEPEQLNVYLLSGPEVDDIREQIYEFHERQTRKWCDRDRGIPDRLACAHCGHTAWDAKRDCFNWGMVLRHMVDKHGIEPVTDTDTVRNPEVNQIPEMYWMWPPIVN